ncbi:hypothetical protein K5I29_00360 [Flavobacterium agricola]|uniref:YchJ-like middle NTF2-like domain-containing protein n=1 Tax=Flavobacterium agricola TaxID=2870839 RepID=A0ABY6M2R7_9FLAO|nr:YchJ family metal-binding protein [Flavobacterium agricola]UYW01446.1 hypothetical protein K5I29_00360 [Flavobacterium agricola]
MNCPCFSGLPYANCCEPYHIHVQNAPTPLALMRSRYSAFATHNADYLMRTTLPAKRKFHDKLDLLDWAQQNTWTNLEIVEAVDNIVEFKAYYTDVSGKPQIQQERSRFQKLSDKWFYVDGI